jgi:hypothetical protein
MTVTTDGAGRGLLEVLAVSVGRKDAPTTTPAITARMDSRKTNVRVSERSLRLFATRT